MSETAGAGLDGLSPAQRQQAMQRFEVVRLQGGTTLPGAATAGGVPVRTARQWMAAYWSEGLAGLVRRSRAGKGQRRLPEEIALLIEGLALRRPAPNTATIHRQILDIAAGQGWPVPTYSTVYDTVAAIDAA
ncbi:leucine zipper domain-containing protein [Nocardia sp. NPDC049220]|uniref:leucine zipper domain-containing protein n=1 Tax=Nocardia sp. NPDC049220 TaxID=3155273 RepID=UPI0033D223B4